MLIFPGALAEVDEQPVNLLEIKIVINKFTRCW